MRVNWIIWGENLFVIFKLDLRTDFFIFFSTDRSKDRRHAFISSHCTKLKPNSSEYGHSHFSLVTAFGTKGCTAATGSRVMVLSRPTQLHAGLTFQSKSDWPQTMCMCGICLHAHSTDSHLNSAKFEQILLHFQSAPWQVSKLICGWRFALSVAYHFNQINKSVLIGSLPMVQCEQ